MYQPDSEVRLEVRLEEDTVWLTQAQMAELFQTSKQNVSLHTNNVFKEKELRQDIVVKDSLTTAADGKNYRVKYYNLDVIISVGYRVKSHRGTQFRQWANGVLKEYLLKGYSVNRRLTELEHTVAEHSKRSTSLSVLRCPLWRVSSTTGRYSMSTSSLPICCGRQKVRDADRQLCR